MENIDIANENKKEYHIFIYHTRQGKYFLFASAKSSVEMYKKFMQKYNYEYKYFVSFDSLKYGKLTACRSRIRGYYVKKADYDNE